MPSPNILKEYKKKAYYHIYNRGINRMSIFKDSRDYQVFTDYLRLSLTPTKRLVKELEQLLILNRNDFQTKQLSNAIQKGAKYQAFKNIDLLAYCLMPNHFHLVVYQRMKNGIEVLMRRVATGYAQYFNKRYHRQGPLFESRYKASHLHYDPELQALFTARYVERNPLDLVDERRASSLDRYPYSSLKYYKGGETKKPVWFNTKRLLKIFKKIKSKPNGIVEDEIAETEDYHEFVVGDSTTSLEDVRLYNAG